MLMNIISEYCDDEVYICGDLDDPCDIPSTLSKIKIEHINRLIMRHLNIN